MQFCRIIPVVSLLVAIAISPLSAQERAGEPPRPETGGIFNLIPADSVTEHVLKTASGDIAYTATAGTLDLHGQNGDRTAKIFYTSYVAKESDANRPVTFAFNGGPGAASAYLHLGLLGPRILDFGAAGNDGTTPELTDNPDSWLQFTDLVLIDPVGTGWSRAASNDAAGNFYGVQQDAESLAKFITLYIQKNGRLGSPKYLLGESYGGFRAAKVASALKESQGILPSGVLMVSPLIDGRFLFGAGNDPLNAALQLPSLAAAEMERRGTFTPERLAEAEQFAMTDYLVSLAGAAPTGEAAAAFYARISEMTGISETAVAQARGFVGDLYAKQSGGEGQVVSPYDAAHTVADAYPQSAWKRNDDPILDGYTRAYGAAFAVYARDELGFGNEMTYTLLNTDVNRRWEWGDRGRAGASASGDLLDLMSVIPSFRLAIFHGYSDALTPHGPSRYVIDHLPPELSRDRAELKVYRGGHMFYTNPDSRRAVTEDASQFYEQWDAD